MLVGLVWVFICIWKIFVMIVCFECYGFDFKGVCDFCFGDLFDLGVVVFYMLEDFVRLFKIGVV